MTETVCDSSVVGTCSGRLVTRHTTVDEVSDETSSDIKVANC